MAENTLVYVVQLHAGSRQTRVCETVDEVVDALRAHLKLCVLGAGITARVARAGDMAARREE